MNLLNYFHTGIIITLIIYAIIFILSYQSSYYNGVLKDLLYILSVAIAIFTTYVIISGVSNTIISSRKEKREKAEQKKRFKQMQDTLSPYELYKQWKDGYGKHEYGNLKEGDIFSFTDNFTDGRGSHFLKGEQREFVCIRYCGVESYAILVSKDKVNIEPIVFVIDPYDTNGKEFLKCIKIMKEKE